MGILTRYRANAPERENMDTDTLTKDFYMSNPQFQSIDFEDFKNRVGYAEDYAAQTEKIRPEDRGIVSEIGSRIARGGLQLADLTSGMLEALDPNGGKDVFDSLANNIQDYTQKLRETSPLFMQSKKEIQGEEGFVRRGIMGGLESSPASIGPTAAGALAGMAVAGPPGALVGGMIGGTVGALGIFGLGTYSNAKKRYMESNIPNKNEKDAEAYAFRQGVTEGGIEFLSNVATMGILKLGTPFAKAFTKGALEEPLSQTIRGLLEVPTSELAKRVSMNMGQEVGTEMLQNYLEAKTDKKYQMGNQDEYQAAFEAIIPAVTMSVLFGASVEGLNHVQRNQLLNEVNSPDVNKRVRAINFISKELSIEEHDSGVKGMSDAWIQYATDKLANNEKIDLDTKVVDYAAQKKQNEIDQVVKRSQEQGATPVKGFNYEQDELDRELEYTAEPPPVQYQVAQRRAEQLARKHLNAQIFNMDEGAFTALLQSAEAKQRLIDQGNTSVELTAEEQTALDQVGATARSPLFAIEPEPIKREEAQQVEPEPTPQVSPDVIDQVAVMDQVEEDRQAAEDALLEDQSSEQQYVDMAPEDILTALDNTADSGVIFNSLGLQSLYETIVNAKTSRQVYNLTREMGARIYKPNMPFDQFAGAIKALSPEAFDRAKEFIPEVYNKLSTVEGGYNEAEQDIATDTSRTTGAVGGQAVTPRYVLDTLKPGEEVLNYGAGKVDKEGAIPHSEALTEAGAKVTNYDFPKNMTEGVHDPNALDKKYDTVMVSNVLNVQSSERMMKNTIDQLANTTKDDGRVVANYPDSPRKSNLTGKDVERLLKQKFLDVKRVGGTEKIPTFQARRPVRGITLESGGLQSLWEGITQAVDTSSTNFRKWFGESKVVAPDGKPLRVYHGTTRDFVAFDRNKANVEGNLGGAFYFSNNPEEVAYNYANMKGPDLQARIETVADRYYENIEEYRDDIDYLESQGITAEELATLSDEDLGIRLATAELSDNLEQTIPVYLSFQNPVEIGGDDQTIFDYDFIPNEEDMQDFRDEAWSEIRDENGLPDDADIRQLYKDQVEELAREKYDESGYEYDEDGNGADLLRAFDEELSMWESVPDGQRQEAVSSLRNMLMDYGSFSAQALIKEMFDMPAVYEAEDYETGAYVGPEIIRSTFERAGYDSIIDHTVNRKFGTESGRRLGGMRGMNPDTVHYLAFNPKQIKSSISNTGEYSQISNVILESGGLQTMYEKLMAMGKTKKEAKQIIDYVRRPTEHEMTLAEAQANQTKRPVEPKPVLTPEEEADPWYDPHKEDNTRGLISSFFGNKLENKEGAVRRGREKLYTAVVDKLFPIVKQLDSGQIDFDHGVATLFRLAENAQNVKSAFLHFGLMELDSDGVVRGKTNPEVKDGFIKWFESLDNHDQKWIGKRIFVQGIEDLLDEDERKYMDGEIEKRRFPNDRVGKITREVIADVKNKAGLPTSKGYRTWSDINDRVQVYNKNVLDLAQKAGIINPETRQLWERNFYMPAYKVLDNEDLMWGVKTPKKGKSNIENAIKELTDNYKNIGDPLTNLMKSWGSLIHNSLRNVALKEAHVKGLKYDAVQSFVGPDGKYSEKEFIKYRNQMKHLRGAKQLNVITYQDEGRPIRYMVKDDELYQAVAGIHDPAMLDGLIGRAVKGAKSALTHSVTLLPAFRIANAMRDSFAVGLIEKNFVPVFDSIRGFGKVWRRSQDYLDLQFSGGGFGLGGYIDLSDEKVMEAELKRIYKLEGNKGKNGLLATLHDIRNFWNRVGIASEMAARTQLYANLKEKGVSHKAAAARAKDILDFQKSGNSKIWKYLTMMTPFLNARLQGLHKVGQAMVDSPVQSQKAFYTKAAAFTLASLALWSLWKDDDRYKKLSDHDKFNYHHMWIGDTHFRLPKAFEFGMLFSTIPEAIAGVYNGSEENKHAMDAFKYALVQGFGINPIPQFLKPELENLTNYNFFTGLPVEGAKLQRRPKEERYNNATPYIYRDLAKVLPLSPVEIDNLVRGHFAQLGATLIGLADIGYRDIMGAPARPAQSWTDMAGISRFMPTEDAEYDKRAQQTFYELLREASEQATMLREYRRSGDMDKALKLYNEQYTLLSQSRFLNRYSQVLSRFDQKIQMVYNDKKMTPKEKREEIAKLQTEKARSLNKVYELLRERNPER